MAEPAMPSRLFTITFLLGVIISLLLISWLFRTPATSAVEKIDREYYEAVGECEADENCRGKAPHDLDK